MTSTFRTDALGTGEHRFAHGDVELHYTVRGHGPLIVAVSPGWGVGSNYLQRSFAYLEDRFRFVYVDTRGSGGSSQPADPAQMSSAAMIEDIDALRVHLGLPRLRLLGHSNGGALVLGYAQRDADKVQQLILIDSQLYGYAASEATQAQLQQWSGDARYDPAIAAVTAFFSGQVDHAGSDATLTAFVSSVMPLYLHAPEVHLATTNQHFLGVVSSYAFRSQNAANAQAPWDQSAELDRVHAPTLVISGRHDWICPLPVAERLHAGIAGSRLRIFEQSGHMPWIEEPAEFATTLADFVA